MYVQPQTAVRTPWIVTIHPQPCPPAGAAVPVELRELWRHYGLRHPRDGQGDVEDWVEQAVRLQVARSLLPHAVLTSDLRSYVDLHTRRPVEVDTAVVAAAPRWGVRPTTPGARVDPADDYMGSAVFQRHAGRQVHLCGFRPDVGTDVEDVLDELAAAGHREVIVKARQTKLGLWRLLLGPDPMQALREALDWTLVRLEGLCDSLLVQEVVEMRYEYRLWVVGQRIVTGAGAIEAHTPLQNTAPLDPAVQHTRDPGCPVERRPDVAEQLCHLGERVVAEWATAQPRLRNYVLDVALGPDDQPLVVERNELPNAGLYACDPTMTLRALLEQHEQRTA